MGVWGLVPRFIPACAGNSASAGAIIPAPSVHPRVCGEQNTSQLGLRKLAGSSPRVRGTVRRRRTRRHQRRFIPACAGNSMTTIRQPLSWAVHPRVCGEQYIFHFVNVCDCGSSPRVRGTGQCKPCHNLIRRFIPACAGNSQARDCFGVDATVHPRVCGEQDRCHFF